MALVALHCSTQIFSNRTPRIYRTWQDGVAVEHGKPPRPLAGDRGSVLALAANRDLFEQVKEVLHSSIRCSELIDAKPLNAKRFELTARIVRDVCDNQCAAARKLLILKTERCPSG
jgi:hypothetical protein